MISSLLLVTLCFFNPLINEVKSSANFIPGFDLAKKLLSEAINKFYLNDKNIFQKNSKKNDDIFFLFEKRS